MTLIWRCRLPELITATIIALVLILPAAAVSAGSLHGSKLEPLGATVEGLGDLEPREDYKVRLGGAQKGDLVGISVADAGDVNGDGRPDFIAGSPWSDPRGRNNAGVGYLVFGTRQRTTLDARDVGRRACRILGENGKEGGRWAGGDLLGSEVAGVGDVNGDGLDDVALSAPLRDQRAIDDGVVYVVFGGCHGTVDLRHLGAAGFRIVGPMAGSVLGLGGGIGDVDSDGRDEVLLRTSLSGTHKLRQIPVAIIIRGRARTSDVLLGKGRPVKGTITSRVGVTDVAPVGDVNGDDRMDFVIGSAMADPIGRGSGSGAAWAVYGRRHWERMSLGDVARSNGKLGFRIDGPHGPLCAFCNGPYTGNNVSHVGDVNADGFDDFAVTAPEESRNDREISGTGYVVLGARQTADPVDLAVPSPRWWAIDGPQAFAGNTLDFVGVGDFDRDGNSDIAVRVMYGSNKNEKSRYMVVMGTDAPQNVDLLGYRGPSVGGPRRGEVAVLAGINRARPGLVTGTGRLDFRGRTRAGRVFLVYP